MKTIAIASTLCLAMAVGSVSSLAVESTPIGEDEARTIAVDAYLYFYPLVTMDLTRKQTTNIEAGKAVGRGPANQFSNIPEFPTADFKVVVRPNFDTLYSSGWLDLTKEPMVVSAPDTNGRYYLLPMLDMWTDVFASPGWRTTGTTAANYIITPPHWRPDIGDRFVDEFKLPEGTQRIEAPTPYVWIIGRTKTDGPSDYPAVHAIQSGYKITPLSEWGKDPKPPQAVIDPTIDMKTPPKEQVDSMSGDKFFAYAVGLTSVNPPHPTDQPIIARLRRAGIEVGKPLDVEKLDPVVQRALTAAPSTARQLMGWKIPTLATVVNNWSMNVDTMGVYGNYYLKRAIVAQLGLGANLPEDAIYPLNIADQDGRPLDGANYVIHFAKDDMPPAQAFWSITLYDNDGYQVANAINRFAVSSWMPFAFNADGSLDIVIQAQSPGKDHEANWLPAPKGPFNLTMRIYAPRSEALTGKWSPPYVQRSQGPSSLTVQ